LLQLGKFGSDGPDGESTVFNVETLIGIKKQNIMMDQAANPKVSTLLTIHETRNIKIIFEPSLHSQPGA
jgi:hypothetical protein